MSPCGVFLKKKKNTTKENILFDYIISNNNCIKQKISEGIHHILFSVRKIFHLLGASNILSIYIVHQHHAGDHEIEPSCNFY